MSPTDIRTTVSSFWKTTTDQELLGCIALALAGILEHLDQMQGESGGPTGQRPASPVRSLARTA